MLQLFSFVCFSVPWAMRWLQELPLGRGDLPLLGLSIAMRLTDGSAVQTTSTRQLAVLGGGMFETALAVRTNPFNTPLGQCVSSFPPTERTAGKMKRPHIYFL